jgi:hypothetical protein
MAQSQAQRSEVPDDQKEGFSNKPVVLADNGRHEGEALEQRLQERRIPDRRHRTQLQRRDEWKTQKISLNADDLLSVARGLEKGHDAIVEKQISKQQLPGPLRIHGRSLREGLLGDWRPFTLLKE